MMLIYSPTCYAESRRSPWRSGLHGHGNASLFRLRLRLCFWNQLLPITALFNAGVHGSDLAAFLDDEWCAALRARFRDGHVWRGEIAIRVSRAAVEDTRPPTATLTGAAAAHEFAFMAFRTFDAHGDWARVLAFWIAGATDEFPEAAALLHEI